MNVKITNASRIKDYRSVLGNTVSIVRGYDEKFALADSDASLVMKTIKAGPGYIIEDTTLTINGRFHASSINKKDVTGLERAIWTTKMTYHSGTIIHFYEASLYGHIKLYLHESTGVSAFGEIFVPDGYDLTMSEIEEKDDFDFKNARQLVLTKLLLGDPYRVEMVESILQKQSLADLVSKDAHTI
ncbi:hypothetical protein KKE54_08825 [bacterium]|jgi:inosine/xanthosine triphosphate pyrophosphatase family protein|nr:hypothetical protein [bacterium]